MAELVFKTLRQEVVDAIRMKILNGELPPGVRIVEQDIAADLGVSRGPVREALRQIEQEGLIEYTRNVGCSVKRIDDRDIYEIYLLRATYEILAVKLCAGKLTDETYSAMEEALSKMKELQEADFHRSIDYDNAFHAGILRQTGLPRLEHAWQSLDSSNIISYYAGCADHAAAVKRQYPIHRELFEVCRTGDMQAICDAVMSHYMLTIQRRMKERGTTDFDYSINIRL